MTSCVLNADSGLYDGTFISHTATGLFRYILFEKYVYILAVEMASPGNQRCANCIGALSFHRPTSTLFGEAVFV